MTDAGIKVVTGIPTLKVHSKICVVSRREQDKLVKYAHIGTGNFNEKTAKIYTDLSLFTKDKEITQEVYNVFDFVRFSYKRFRFNHLIVSPLNSRNKLYGLIDQEIEFVQQGKRGDIQLKINNLVDDGLIKRLYKASQAGVKIRIIVRGMCSLVPGVKGLSDNISIISIIDRFLEHPRIMVFRNGGDRKIFITSGDWMTRNIDNRIEVGVPIYDAQAQKMILDILNIHFTDTLKARIIDKGQKNNYVRRGRRKKLRSQMAIYEYIKEMENPNVSEE